MPPRSATPPRAAVRPPPQRRGGEPAAVPQTTNSRALENPEHRSLLFPHSFARSLLRKPQNAAAPSVVAGELRSAAADPLPPSPGSNPRHHELRLAPLKLLGPASPPNRHQSAAAIYLNAGKQAAAANPPFQTRSAPTDPSISTTRVLRISQASPPPQSAATERSPASYPSRRRTSPRGTPNPTPPSPKKTTFGFVSASSSFPPTQTSPPVSRGAGKGRPSSLCSFSPRPGTSGSNSRQPGGFYA